MISTEHSSNNGKNKVTKKTSKHGNTLKARRTFRDLISQTLKLTPREKIELKVAHVSTETDDEPWPGKEPASREGLTLIFLRMLENLIAESLKWYSKNYRAVTRFLVHNFCTYCSNFEQNSSWRKFTDVSDASFCGIYWTSNSGVKCSLKFRHESPSLSSLEVIACTIENKMAAWRKKRPHKLRLVFQFVATLKSYFFLIWHLQACL